MTKPYNWIHHNAEEAWRIKADYGHIIRGETQVAEGPDVLALLADNVKDSTLYTFCYPSCEVRERAAVVGVAAIHSAISRRDVAQCIAAGCNFRSVGDGDSGLLPMLNTSARREILARWPRAKVRDYVAWLKIVAATARARRSDYAILVRDNLIVWEGFGPNAGQVEFEKMAGCILFTFCEPDGRMLAQATMAGIVAVYCVISRRDALKISLFGLVTLKPIKVQRIREEALVQWQ